MSEVRPAAETAIEPEVEEGPKVFYPVGHFLSPMPDTRELAREPHLSRIWPPAPRPTPGIDWREQAQIELCRNVFAPLSPLLFPDAPTDDPHAYFRSNDAFQVIDACVLQAMLRRLEPRRMIEVGCGYSSLVSARVNRELLDGRMRLTCIDPYPRDYLREGVPGISEFRVEQIQSTPLELFDELGENDVLFIDTSHTVKTGGDVQWIYGEIIPRLRPGVHVHLHDAFLPGDYPKQWVLEGWGWNEIYLIQAFLAFNRAWEVVLGVHWMNTSHPEALRAAFPELTEHEARYGGGSLWIRRADGR